MEQQITHGSLFSGIGGFDLAAEWAGWQNVFHCEWNEFGQKVLKHYWPKAISYADITKTDFSIHRGTIDVLTGGFPCQPYSMAGKRLGKEDDRHLWPEMLRAIREIQPQWVVGENVFGLINWDGGLVFHEVQADLEAEGYEVQPYVLPACSINAPHRRDRVWFVANAKSDRNRGGVRPMESANGGKREPKEYGENDLQPGDDGAKRNAPNPERIGQPGSRRAKQPLCPKAFGNWKASWSYDDGRWPTQPPVCSGDDGLPTGLDGITLSKWRNESIKAGGNAIVPQVAYQIFQAINQYNA